MVYPVPKVPRGRFRNDVGRDDRVAGEWDREKNQGTVAAEDGEALWQDVSSEALRPGSDQHGPEIKRAFPRLAFRT